LIACSVDNILWHRQAMAVVKRIDQLVQVGDAGVIQSLHNAVLNVIANRGSPESIGGKVILHGWFDVNHVDDQRHDSNDTWVESGEPSGPAALRTARDYEFIDRLFTTLLRSRYGCHGIH